MKADLEKVLQILDAAGFKPSAERNRTLNATKQQRADVQSKSKGRAKLVRRDWSVTVGPRTVYFWKGRESGVINSDDTRKFETRDYGDIRNFLNTWIGID